jgi:hypothetical protein
MREFDMVEFFNPIKQRKVFIRRGAIVGCDYDGANKVNIVYVPGGMFPVQESLEEIATKIQLPTEEGKSNE